MRASYFVMIPCVDICIILKVKGDISQVNHDHNAKNVIKD